MSKEAMKLALEEMKIGNYNSAAERLETALAEQPAQQEPDAFVPREAIRTLSGGANHVPATLTLNDDGGKAVAVFLSPQPAQHEPVAALQRVMARLSDLLDEDQFAEIEGIVTNAGVLPPAQRKPLTLGQKQRLWSSVGDKPTLKDRVNAYGLAIEAAHGIKEQP
jgi:hypothetical protein